MSITTKVAVGRDHELRRNPHRERGVYFWHGHDCHLFKWPKTEELFWRQKIVGNIRRDITVREQLRENGWRIGEVWECTLKGRERRPPNDVLADVGAFLRGEATHLVIGTDQRVTFSDEA